MDEATLHAVSRVIKALDVGRMRDDMVAVNHGDLQAACSVLLCLLGTPSPAVVLAGRLSVQEKISEKLLASVEQLTQRFDHLVLLVAASPKALEGAP